jgi:lipopolysaccharide transport system ATP-binding protein
MSAAVVLSDVTKIYRTASGGSLKDVVARALRRGGQSRIGHEHEFLALDDVSFEIAEGDAFGLVGRNGAGKSTLLKILARVTSPTRGEVILRGRVGSLLEVGTGFHMELTGRENIALAAEIQGMRPAELRRRFDQIVAFSEVERWLDEPVKHYSSGMYLRLAFAVAAHLDPDILLVDEALAVGDARFQQKCVARMHEILGRGGTIVLVSHQHQSILEFCRNAAWLDGGRLRCTGSATDVMAKYLGEAVLSWRGDAGDDTLRLRATYVEPDAGVVLSADAPLRIGFVAELRRSARDLVAAIELRGAAGNLLAYSAYDDDLPPPAERLPPGAFCRELIVPANTLAPGRYEVSFDFGLHNEKRIIDGQGTLQFDMQAGTRFARRFPSEKWNGAFRPEWTWRQTARSLP